MKRNDYEHSGHLGYIFRNESMYFDSTKSKEVTGSSDLKTRISLE